MKFVAVLLVAAIAVAHWGSVSAAPSLVAASPLLLAAPGAPALVAAAPAGSIAVQAAVAPAPVLVAAAPAPVVVAAPAAIQPGYVAATRGAVHVAPLPGNPIGAASHHLNLAAAPGTH